MLIFKIFSIFVQPIHLTRMKKTKKCRVNLKPERNEQLWIEYGNVIARYGKSARFMAKSELYRQAGESVHLKVGSATNIIRRMIRERGHPDF